LHGSKIGLWLRSTKAEFDAFLAINSGGRCALVADGDDYSGTTTARLKEGVADGEWNAQK